MSEIQPRLLRGRYISEVGKQGWICTCTLCQEEFRVYEWSIHGKGKKCPGCGHIYSSGDLE